MTDFSNIESLASHRAADGAAKERTPRDVLLDLLGMIDRGAVNPVRLVVILDHHYPEGGSQTQYHAGGQGERAAYLGMVEIAKLNLWEQSRG